MDSLFLDPTWRDPDVSMVGVPSQGASAFKAPPSMARLSSNVQGSGAEDPFSQLSLSRDTSGETLHTERDVERFTCTCTVSFDDAGMCGLCTRNVLTCTASLHYSPLLKTPCTSSSAQ